MVPIDLNAIDCDYYTASCHKWFSAPFGSGFLYVRSRHKQGLKPNILSWGRSLAGAAPNWKDEFDWPGTFDPTPSLTIPAALDFLEQYGLERFRSDTHALARYARKRLLELPGTAPLTSDSPDWYGSMVTIRLPLPDEPGFPGKTHPLQQWLWEQHQIEIPVIRWRENIHLRVSCHLYNSRAQIDGLLAALQAWLPGKTI
jgi:isopenicillin-N epimerase